MENMDAVSHSPVPFSDPSISAPAENLGTQNLTEYGLWLLNRPNQASQQSVYETSTPDSIPNAQG